MPNNANIQFSLPVAAKKMTPNISNHNPIFLIPRDITSGDAFKNLLSNISASTNNARTKYILITEKLLFLILQYGIKITIRFNNTLE